MEPNPFHTVLWIVLTLAGAPYIGNGQAGANKPRDVEQVIHHRSRLYADPIQDDEQSPPLDHLRNDYRLAAVVAHVRAHEAEIANKIAGYEEWQVVCEVVEPFKGKFGRGKQIEYYVIAETGFRKEGFTGEKIIFLLRHYNKQEKKWFYMALENSTLSYTKASVEKLRLISTRHKKKNLRN
jgi:hypothetical protein